MRQAIVTKYIGPTNHRSARVIATCQAGTLTLDWDHALYIDANHTAAARALAVYLGWDGAWVGGGMPGGYGNAYTVAPVAGGLAINHADFFVDRTPGPAPIDEGKPAIGAFRRHRS